MLPRLLLVILFLKASSSFSLIRQPAYYVLGEEEFSGVQVYDVIQDNDWNYWFSTNEGLIYYDHYKFEKIECATSKSFSFFNFVINEEGIIFCNNINNQIFKIEKKKCSLIYEVSSTEVSLDLRLIITPENKLLVGCKNILLIDEFGNLLERFNSNFSYTGLPYRSSINEIIFPISNSDTVIVYAKEKFQLSTIVFPIKDNKSNRLLQFFNIGDKAFAIDLRSKLIFHFNEQDFTITPFISNELMNRSPSIRIYSTENNFWAAGTLPGIACFDEKLTSLTEGLFYKDVFISDVYQDREGNILLCTFDHGILVVADLETPDVIRDFIDDPIAVINHDIDNQLLLGTTKGNLIRYENQQFEIIHQGGKRAIEVIVTSPNFPWLIFDDGYIRALNKQNGRIVNLLEASLKDGVVINDHQVYISANTGLAKITLSGEGNFTIDWITNLKFRNYAVEYNAKNNLIYTSTIYGLFVVDSSGVVEELLYNNESIFASSLYNSNNDLYIPLTKSKILVIEGKHVKSSIDATINNKSTAIYKMILYNNTILALTENGLCQFDISGKLLKSFNETSLQSNQRVLDFAIIEDILWISRPKGLQTIDLNYLIQPIPVPQIKIANVFANDLEIPIDSTSEFGSEFRKFQFKVSSPTLKYKSEIRYHYKLIGYDENWIIADYFSNEVLYNALAPGDYEFIVKAQNQNQFSAPISYKFSIAYPFYLTWLFITLLILIFLATVFSIYRWQLNATRQKAKQINELNASKLTAIQSQMNPHFIFNSLNSIQDLILKGDVENSYSYITTFSNLVRRTLSYSDKDFIDFEHEIKLLELYLSLEKLRFKKDFSYVINKNEITDIQIPPMLIQPFIENALVHGLLHKEGDKKLTITFSVNRHLICVIEDNGIGREQAKAIKSRQRSEHESFSVQAIRKRFEILSEHFKGELGYVYEDMTENGKAIGTRVTLQIPIKHKF